MTPYTYVSSRTGVSRSERRLAAASVLFAAAYASYQIAGFFYPELPAAILSFLFYGGFLASAACITFRPPSSRWHWSVSTPTALGAAILLSFSISIALQHLFLKDLYDDSGKSSFAFAGGILTLGIAWGVWGAAAQRWRPNYSMRTAIVLLALVAGPICLNLDENLLVPYMHLTELRGDGVELTHLYLGDNSVLLLLLAFSFAPRLRPLFGFGAALILFALGGRTALYVFAAATTFYSMRRMSLKRGLAFACGLSAAAALIFFLVDPNNGHVQRMLMAQGLAEDSSIQGREEYLLGGLDALWDQVWIGDPTFPARTFGSVGAYIHNVLNAWQFFGLLPFVALSTSILLCGRRVLKEMRGATDPIHEFGTMLFLYATLSLLLAKSLEFANFWFALGFWLMRMSDTNATQPGKR